MTLFADHHLARRIESLEVKALKETGKIVRELEGESAADWIELAGACSLHAGANSVIGRAKGFGMSGEITRDQLDLFERFHAERGSRLSIYLCPLADPSALRVLGERGYAADSFVNVLALSLRDAAEFGSSESGVGVEKIGENQADCWSELVARAFSEGLAHDRDLARTTRIYARYPSGACFFARKTGEPAGGGMVVIHDGVAMLQTTAVLPEHRTGGAHRALVLARLAYAAEHGCDLAVCRTRPGAPSQRNLERLGFRVVYTEVKMTKTG
jgi:GNAT superfamily N-acetyltransferase